MTMPAPHTMPHNIPGLYAATMAAYAEATSSLLARLDGCLGEASASSGAVKPVFRRPDLNEGDKS